MDEATTTLDAKVFREICIKVPIFLHLKVCWGWGFVLFCFSLGVSSYRCRRVSDRWELGRVMNFRKFSRAYFSPR